MLIIDGDYPMATGALVWDRDLSWELSRIRTAEPGIVKNGGWPDAYTMASLPEMRKAQIAAALVKVCSCVKRPGHPHGEFRTQNLAYAGSMGQLRTIACWRPREKPPSWIPARRSRPTWTLGRMPPTTPSCRSAS